MSPHAAHLIPLRIADPYANTLPFQPFPSLSVQLPPSALQFLDNSRSHFDMNRSSSMLPEASTSSPLAPANATEDVKRRKSHQWFLGVRRPKASDSQPGTSRMSFDTASLPAKNPARAMLERRHSHQNVDSRIPQVCHNMFCCTFV
ncbi:hypothetical protein NUW54_g7076 [Trametes sanguinea]|uniref:Uncharacterized protein n=1 Tax=Trametes sanguinea TaxID=158606 RepID=A0ACC1PS30_9APHY|nr:hypothetical protein NUW54_g7076 [Trametes sanguinea]